MSELCNKCDVLDALLIERKYLLRDPDTTEQDLLSFDKQVEAVLLLNARSGGGFITIGNGIKLEIGLRSRQQMIQKNSSEIEVDREYLNEVAGGLFGDDENPYELLNDLEEYFVFSGVYEGVNKCCCQNKGENNSF